MSIQFYVSGLNRDPLASTPACMHMTYRGYTLSFTTIMGREEAATFHNGEFLFEFSPTVEGIAIAKRKIDRWKRREP